MHIDKHICIMHINTCICTYRHIPRDNIYILAQIQKHTYIYIYKYIDTNIQEAHMYTDTHVHLGTCIHTQGHMYTDTHVHRNT